MFATLRAEERDGEVVCISSTNHPLASGQNPSHFACDGCRAKKLKCSGHRFGCQRCRDRNLVCRYTHVSQPRRHKARARVSTLQRVSPFREAASPSSGNSAVSSRTSLEDAKSPMPKQFLEQALTKQVGHSDVPATPRPTINRDPDGSVSAAQLLPESTNSSSCSPPTQSVSAAPDFSDVALPEHVEQGFQEFDMDEFLEVDLALTEHEARETTIESVFGFSSSSENSHNSRATSFTNTSASSDQDRRKWEEESLPPPKRTFTSLSSDPRPPMKCPPGTNPSMGTHQPREGLAARDRPQITNASPPCCCIGVALGHLEKAQGHTKLTSLCAAERSLYSLKKSISQCHELLQCKTCRNPSRVMTFLILSIEKMVVMLEDIASVWETNLTHSIASPRDSSQLDLYGHATRWLPVHLGQFQIDTVQEQLEVFGFLILLQARQMALFLQGLVSHAEREDWHAHQTALRPVGLRIRDLQETLSGLGGNTRLGLAPSGPH